jgi:Cu(I)/Ag(I) efflux system membrane fusion protein
MSTINKPIKVKMMKREYQIIFAEKAETKNKSYFRTGIYSVFYLFTFCVFALACTDKKTEHVHQNTDEKDQVYYCPMDTQIVRSKPGTCPICGMDLVLKPGTHPHKAMDSGEMIYTPTNVSVLSTVKSINPEIKTVPIKINTNGYISYDERRINTISAKIAGRVEKLFIKYNFQPIKTGQPLFEIFSHELQTAQQEYLYLKRNEEGGSELLNSGKRKLKLLGMTDEQINKLNSDYHIHATTTVYSPIAGFVIEQDKNGQELSSNSTENKTGMEKENPSMPERNTEVTLREGAYVDKGAPVFRIANTESVWAILEVFTDQLIHIRKGQQVHIMVENTNEMVMGKVDFIEPSYKSGSGTTRIRVYINNKDQHLKIGNLIHGVIDAGEKKAMWIPIAAVYDLGIDKIVFLKKDGVFETKIVKLGTSTESQVEVIEGLSIRDEISGNAQFMVDSESFVKTAK